MQQKIFKYSKRARLASCFKQLQLPVYARMHLWGLAETTIQRVWLVCLFKLNKLDLQS